MSLSPYIDNLAVYWVLRIFMLAVLVFCGYGITYRNKDNRYFWYYAIPAIIVYALVEGLRYGRGVDYAQYATEFMGQWYEEGFREFLYDCLVRFVVNFEIPYWAAFIFLSALLLYSFLLVLKRLPALAFWALPLFFLMTDYQAECLVRQFTAVPFLFFAFAAYLSNKRIWMFLSLAVIPLIHLSGAGVVLLFLILVYFDPAKYIKNPWILILFYVLCIALFAASFFDKVADIVGGSTDSLGDSKFEEYADDADHWFSEDGSLSNRYNGMEVQERSLMGKTLYFIFDVMTIYFGFLAAKFDRRMVIPFFLTYFALILGQISGDVELYLRFRGWLEMLQTIVIAYIIVKVPKHKYFQIGYIIIVVFRYYYYFLKGVGTMPTYGAGFVWDII